MTSNLLRKVVLSTVGIAGAMAGMLDRAEAYSAKCGWTCIHAATGAKVDVKVSCPSKYSTASCWSTGVNIQNPTNFAYATGMVNQKFGCYSNTNTRLVGYRGDELIACSNDLS